MKLWFEGRNVNAHDAFATPADTTPAATAALNRRDK
jgi:hypothetical protein